MFSASARCAGANAPLLPGTGRRCAPYSGGSTNQILIWRFRSPASRTRFAATSRSSYAPLPPPRPRRPPCLRSSLLRRPPRIPARQFTCERDKGGLLQPEPRFDGVQRRLYPSSFPISALSRREYWPSGVVDYPSSFVRSSNRSDCAKVGSQVADAVPKICAQVPDSSVPIANPGVVEQKPIPAGLAPRKEGIYVWAWKSVTLRFTDAASHCKSLAFGISRGRSKGFTAAPVYLRPRGIPKIPFSLQAAWDCGTRTGALSAVHRPNCCLMTRSDLL